jgi:hypothetical protein
MFTYQLHDGTVVNDDVILELAAKATDLNMFQTQVADWLNAKSVCWALIGQSDQPALPITWDQRQALSGITDLLRYGKYSNLNTTEGLHILTTASLALPHAEDIGSIHTSYAGDLMPAPAVTNVKGKEYHWQQVGIRLGNLYSIPMSKKYRDPRNAKHDFIEYLIQGYALKVRIAPIRDFAATILVQWYEKDDEVALNFRSQRFAASRVRKNVIKPAGYDGWKATEAANKAGEHFQLPEELNMLSVDGGVIDLTELSTNTDIQLYLGGIPIQCLAWKPTDATRVKTFQNMVVSEPEMMAEVLS